MPEISPGDSVWVTDQETPDRIIEQELKVHMYVVRIPDWTLSKK